MPEINTIDLLNACSKAQAIANKTGKAQEIKIKDFAIEKQFFRMKTHFFEALHKKSPNPPIW